MTFAVAIATSEGYAGLFMTTDVGTLASLTGQGTQLIAGGITHSAPKKVVNGVATFEVGWTAPGSPGGVNVQVWALAANGDGTPNGDGPGMAFEAFAFGCSGMVFYRDFDGDGYAAPENGYTRNCTMPVGYALVQGDCNDNDASIHPGAMEICNHIDDNCNGLIDEGLPVMTYYLDNSGTAPPGSPPTVVDCAPPPGYCELASCGTGWCRRLASGCDSNDCMPGPPRPETCNDFDDDCDGVIDNGTDLELCGATGLHCVSGQCVKPGTIPDAGAIDALMAIGPASAGRASGAGELTGAGGDGPARRYETGGCEIAGPTALTSLTIVLAPLGGVLLLIRLRRRRVSSARHGGR